MFYKIKTIVAKRSDLESAELAANAFLAEQNSALVRIVDVRFTANHKEAAFFIVMQVANEGEAFQDIEVPAEKEEVQQPKKKKK